MSDVSDFLDQIQTMYGRDYKDDESVLLRNRLFASKFSTEILIRAVKDIESIDSNYLPSPKQVLGACENARYSLAPKENKINKPAPVDKKQSEMGIIMSKLITGGKATRQQILDKIRTADRARPNTGWDKCGMSLEKYYRDHNLPLDKTPNNYVGADL